MMKIILMIMIVRKKILVPECWLERVARVVMSVAFNCYYSDPEQLVTLWLSEKAYYGVPGWTSSATVVVHCNF